MTRQIPWLPVFVEGVVIVQPPMRTRSLPAPVVLGVEPTLAAEGLRAGLLPHCSLLVSDVQAA